MFRGVPSSITLNLRRYEQLILKNIENSVKELNKNIKTLTEVMKNQQNITGLQQELWKLHNKIKEVEVLKNEHKE